MDNNYLQKEFMLRFRRSKIFKGEKDVLDKVFGRPILYFPQEVDGQTQLLRMSSRSCTTRGEKCEATLLKALSKAMDKFEPVSFSCTRSNRKVAILPLKSGKHAFGYLIFCHLKRVPTKAELALLTSLIQTGIEEVRREVELAQMEDAARPRTVALSTVHTMHRIVNSTLKLDELLPRIGRLSQQVIKARKVKLFLVDKTGKYLIPKVSINGTKADDLSNTRKRKMGKDIESRVAHSAETILKPGSITVPLFGEDIVGVISVSEKEGKKKFDNFDKEIMETMAEQAVIAIKNANSYEEQENIAQSSLKSLAMVMRERLPRGHIGLEAFSQIAMAIANELGLSDEEKRGLNYATILHDAGKLSVSDDLLTKPRRLTIKEYQNVQRTLTKGGARIVGSMEILRPAMPIILHQQERFDGTGYPNGLKGNDIPIGARIMTVMNAFEAMVSDRPYRKALSIEEAKMECQRYSGSQFDPKIVQAFLNVFNIPRYRNLIKKKNKK